MEERCARKVNEGLKGSFLGLHHHIPAIKLREHLKKRWSKSPNKILIVTIQCWSLVITTVLALWEPHLFFPFSFPTFPSQLQYDSLFQKWGELYRKWMREEPTKRNMQLQETPVTGVPCLQLSCPEHDVCAASDCFLWHKSDAQKSSWQNSAWQQIYQHSVEQYNLQRCQHSQIFS